MKATDMLKKQHRQVLGMFKEVEKTDDPNERRRLLEEITEALKSHSEIEEEVFYPAIRETGAKKAEELVLQALEEHHVVDLLLAETPDVDPEAENFEAKMRVLREIVAHHIEEEEQEMFKLASRLKDDEARDLGRRLEEQSGAHAH
jgi:iron-sulfur cluster repair protein YtfE (RIC family)